MQALSSARYWPLLLVFWVILAAVPFGLSSADGGAYVQFATLLPVSLSFFLIAGLSGEISLAQGSFFGLGGYFAAALSAHFHVSLWLGLLAGAAVCCAISVIVGVVSFGVGLRGLYFAVSTLALAEAAGATISHIGFFNRTDGFILPIDGGAAGMMFNNQAYYSLLGIALSALAFVCLVGIGRSRLGLSARVARADENLATAFGFRPAATKIIVFIIGAAISGAAGVIYAASNVTVEPTGMFDISRDFDVVLACLLGGLLAPIGPVVGTAVVIGLTYLISRYVPVSNINNLVFGVVLIAVALGMPDGICGRWRRQMRMWASREVGVSESAASGSDRKEDAGSEEGRERIAQSLALTRRPSTSTGSSGRQAPVLQGSGVAVRYGAVYAVRGMSFELGEGEILGLIGPNGAGKTSLFNGISGHVPMTGELRLGGMVISTMPAWARARAGIARTFQTPAVVPELTVGANLGVGLRSYSTAGTFTRDVIDLLGLGGLLQRDGHALSGAELKRMEVARALLARSRVLLLDETMAGLSQEEQRGMIRVVGTLREAGLGIIFVEHLMDVVTEIADRVIVLDHGAVLAEGKPSEALADEAVRGAYLVGGRRPGGAETIGLAP